jgi:hypothetical protein
MSNPFGRRESNQPHNVHSVDIETLTARFSVLDWVIVMLLNCVYHVAGMHQGLAATTRKPLLCFEIRPALQPYDDRSSPDHAELRIGTTEWSLSKIVSLGASSGAERQA